MKPASGGEGNRTNNVPTAPTLGSKTNTVYTCFDVCDLWNGWVTRRDIYIATFARVGNYTSLLSILGVPPLSPEQKKEGTHHRSSFSSSIGTRISKCVLPSSRLRQSLSRRRPCGGGPSALQAQTPQPQDCGHFVQQFYDW